MSSELSHKLSPKRPLQPRYRVISIPTTQRKLRLSPDPTTRHSWFTLIIGGIFTYCSLYGINQMQVQRYLTMKDYKTAVRSLWVSWPLLTLLSVSTCFSGLAIYASYHNCDPIKAGRIASTDQLLPLYVMDTMGKVPGLIGLFVAGIFSASLSTVSAACNSLAAVTLEDYIKPLYSYSTNRTISDRRGGQLSKVLTFIYGLVCLCIAYLAKYLGSVLQASLTIFGVVGGPVLGVFTLGMTVTFANQQGALAGIVSGLLFCSLVGFGGPKPAPKKLPSTIEGCPNLVPSLSSILRLDNSVDNNFIDEDATTIRYTDMSSSQDQYFYLYRISYMYYIVLGFCVTMLVGAIVSRFFETPSYDVNLLTPWVAARARRKHNGPYKEPELSPETVHMKNNNEQKGCDNEFSCDTTVSTQFKLN